MSLIRAFYRELREAVAWMSQVEVEMSRNKGEAQVTKFTRVRVPMPRTVTESLVVVMRPL